MWHGPWEDEVYGLFFEATVRPADLPRDPLASSDIVEHPFIDDSSYLKNLVFFKCDD